MDGQAAVVMAAVGPTVVDQAVDGQTVDQAAETVDGEMVGIKSTIYQ